jgi:glycosyltransferase involved in cell wall biosynthesis
MQKIVFIISHPIQYYVPLLQGLSKNPALDVLVLYTWGKDSIAKFDPGFNKVIEWDLPLLEGYNYEFLENVAKDPGTHHFKGIDNPSIVDRIKELAPDKLVLFGWSFKSHLTVLRKFSGKIPIYFRGDSHLLDNAGLLKSSVRKLYLTWLYRHVDFAIAVGSQNKKYYKWLGLKDHQILFAPHAIDDHRFKDNIESDKQLALERKQQMQIPSDHLVFIYVGKFEYRKNLQTLISAKLKLKNSKCSLVLVGNGPDEPVLKALASTDEHIHFIDFVNQAKIASIYRMADVFVLPSISETWGLGINEAMNCGLAIIASDKVGSAIDLVNQNGYIFKNQDIEDLSAKMNDCILDRVQIDKFKSTSLNIIKDWSLSTLISKFEQALLSK